MLIHKYLTTLGLYLELMGRTFSRPERMRMFLKQYLKEMSQLGVDSIGIVLLISFFIGAVICIQIKLNIQSPWMPRFATGYTYMRKLNYPAVLFAVGCMTIGSAAMSCGMDNILSKALLPLMQGTEFYTVMATYVSGVLLNLLLTPMAAYASLTASVVEIAQHLQVSPLLLVYTFSYGLDQYIFPYEYAILLYFYATGYIRIKQIMLVLGIRMALAALFVAFVAYPYWKLFL